MRYRQIADERVNEPDLTMRVAIDFDAVAANRFSGFHTYGAGLLRGFNTLAKHPEAVLVSSRCWEGDVCRIAGDSCDWVSVRSLPIKARWLENIWRYSRYPSLEHIVGDFDIYHCVHHLMPPGARGRRILTVHDLRRYMLPELYRESKLWRFELAVQRAEHFIAVSQSTKTDLCRIFGVPEEKVDVIHLAADEGLSPLTDAEKSRLKLKFEGQVGTSLERFVMAVSASCPRKNIERTIRAFKSIKTRLPDGTKLVVAGVPSRDFDEREQGHSDDDIIRTGPVDDLKELLGCADAFIYASLYEGFGIPILEAFACGVPVITSNLSSMPEVAGDAAILVNPYDENAIAKAIEHLCNDERERERLIEAGLKRVNEFAWSKTAAETLGVYEKLLGAGA